MNIQSQFLSAMRKAEIEPDCAIVADGKLHRFRDWLDKPSTRNCWYVLFPDFPPAGAFGCWRRGISERWSSIEGNDSNCLTLRFTSIDFFLAFDHDQARLETLEKWNQASPANGKHDYLIRKRILAHGIRYLQGALLVPVMDSAGNIYGLQRIYRDGAKRFIYGTDKRGHFFMIGTPANKIICIAEGYATAATIHELTGLAAVVAFDAGNLLAVSENISTAYPEYELILCADDDRFIEGNPGLTKAKTAACACGGTLLIPRFADVYSRGTDFNDQFVEEGGRSVLDCFATGGIDNV